MSRSLLVEMADGSGTVDLCTEEGALKFLEGHHEPCVTFVEALQREDTKNDIKLVLTMDVFANTLSKRHASKLSMNECEAVASYLQDKCVELQSNDQWVQTGTLDDFHFAVIGSIVAFSKIPLFVKLFLKRGFFYLAEFYRVSTKQFPSPAVSETLLKIVNNANGTLTDMTIEAATAHDMVDLMVNPIKYLELTGLVIQAIRALTAPILCRSGTPISGYLDFVNCLIRDEKLVRKRFAPDKPSGKILKALLDGADGWKPRGGEKPNPDLPAVLERLRMLQTSSTTSKSDSFMPSCRKCNKRMESMRKCSKCKLAAYCSRECQKDDWKQHKKLCRQQGNNNTSGESMSLARVTGEWVRNNYMETMTEVSRVTRACGVAKKDVVLLADMLAKDPPVVVKTYKDLIQGNGMPDWSGCKYNRDFLAGLEDQHRRMTTDHLLLVHRSYDTDYGVCRFQLATPSGFQLYSDEALANFPLDSPEKLAWYMSTLGVKP